jgi:hypothetical protein
MKILLFFCFFYVLVGCSSSTEKVVDLDELNKPSLNYKEGNESRAKKVDNPIAYDSLSFFSKRLIDTFNFEKKNVKRIENLLFPDRFNPVKSEKWYAIYGEDSLVYKHWKYLDSVVSENTYYNWLDNFGERHLSLKFGDKMNVSKNAFVLLLQDRSLLLFESRNNIDLPTFISTLDTLGFGNTWKFVLFQNKGKKTEWFEQFKIKSKNENSKP